MIEQSGTDNTRVYRPGLDRTEEAVVSSHFMHGLAGRDELRLYEDDRFVETAKALRSEDVFDRLLPRIVRSAEGYAHERALIARSRAVTNRGKYGIVNREDVGVAETIAEVFFDSAYFREAERTCERLTTRDMIRGCLDAGKPVRLVIPALPFKIPCPLKTRGAWPDLAEVGFVLALFEIVKSIELIQIQFGSIGCPKASFAVVSDGSRFNELVGEPRSTLISYQAHLRAWIARLKMEEYVVILDYRELLERNLPSAIALQKAMVVAHARREYERVMWPIFDPADIDTTLRLATKIDPDPEDANAEGRFVALFRSLAYTIQYRCLSRFSEWSPTRRKALFCTLAQHLFTPYTNESASLSAGTVDEKTFDGSDRAMEHLRVSMLKEIWQATISYIAEIKGDRELSQDPILTCLPGYVRCTIHAKAGQFAVLSARAAGLRVEAWAGMGVFKRTKQKQIRLCTLPAIALESAGAIPFVVRDAGGELPSNGQPLFYLHPDVGCSDLEGLLAELGNGFTRKRTS